MEQLEEAPITARQIAALTKRDPVLALVYRYIQEGWPASTDRESIKPYWHRRLELSTLNGCIVWGGRVVIPPPVREALLAELHSGHPGCTRMKALARGLLWWPLLDRDIERTVNASAVNRPSPCHRLLHLDHGRGHPGSGHAFTSILLVLCQARCSWW